MFIDWTLAILLCINTTCSSMLQTRLSHRHRRARTAIEQRVKQASASVAPGLFARGEHWFSFTSLLWLYAAGFFPSTYSRAWIQGGKGEPSIWLALFPVRSAGSTTTSREGLLPAVLDTAVCFCFDSLAVIVEAFCSLLSETCKTAECFWIRTDPTNIEQLSSMDKRGITFFNDADEALICYVCVLFWGFL